MTHNSSVPGRDIPRESRSEEPDEVYQPIPSQSRPLLITASTYLHLSSVITTTPTLWHLYHRFSASPPSPPTTAHQYQKCTPPSSVPRGVPCPSLAGPSSFSSPFSSSTSSTSVSSPLPVPSIFSPPRPPPSPPPPIQSRISYVRPRPNSKPSFPRRPLPSEPQQQLTVSEEAAIHPRGLMRGIILRKNGGR